MVFYDGACLVIDLQLCVMIYLKRQHHQKSCAPGLHVGRNAVGTLLAGEPFANVGLGHQQEPPSALARWFPRTRQSPFDSPAGVRGVGLPDFHTLAKKALIQFRNHTLLIVHETVS